MKRILVLVALCVFGFSFNASAQYDDPPKKQIAQDIADGLHGAKGTCRKDDGTTGKWFPTRMTETTSYGQSNSRGTSSSSSSSTSVSSEISLSGPKAGLNGTDSNSNSYNRNSTNNRSTTVSYEYECR